MPCILAECWMTRSNRLAKERTWHPVWALVQIGAAPTLVILNNIQTNATHATDPTREKRQVKFLTEVKHQNHDDKKEKDMHKVGWGVFLGLLHANLKYLIFSFQAFCWMQRSSCLRAEGAGAFLLKDTHSLPFTSHTLISKRVREGGRRRVGAGEEKSICNDRQLLSCESDMTFCVCTRVCVCVGLCGGTRTLYFEYIMFLLFSNK